MADIDHFARKRPAGILNSSTWEDWFRLIHLHFIGEQLDFVLNTTEAEYAFEPAPSRNSDGTASVKEGVWDEQKRAKWKAACAKVLWTIEISLEQFDKQLINELVDPKTVWTKLYTKYSKVRPTTSREDKKKLYSFQKDPDMSIENSWIQLNKYRRKVVRGNSTLALSLQETELLDILLSSLPDEFAVTRATLDAQPNLSVYDKLQLLQDQEDVIKATASLASANIAEKRSDKRKTSSRRYRSDSDSDSYIECFICGENHRAHNCDLRTEVRAFADSIREKRRQYKKSGHKPGRRPQRTDSTKPISQKSRHSDRDKKPRKKHSSHVADGESDSEADVDSDTDSSDSEDETEETAAISRAEIQGR